MTTLDGRRDGKTFELDLDLDRLNQQARDVFAVMCDRAWHSLAELSERTGHPEASISARLRDLRKPRFGSHVIARSRSGGTHFYRWEGRA